MEKNGDVGWNRADHLQRAGELLTQARSIAHNSEVVLNVRDAVAAWDGPVSEVNGGCRGPRQQSSQQPPRLFRPCTEQDHSGARGGSDFIVGKSDSARSALPWLFNRYNDMGFASLLLGRDTDAIKFLERSLSINPDYYSHQRTFRFLAAAYARTGRVSEARHALSEADRLFPYDTVRSHWPDDPSSIVYADQIRQMQDALRLAGERDHADETADFNVPIDAELHNNFAGPTPMAAPGATTVRTADLARFLTESQPVVIDTVSYSWGRSIPGAIGLSFRGVGGSFADTAQDRLRSKMRELSAGDLNRPIVAVGFNSERFDGRNLALRLAALGYTQVYWYAAAARRGKWPGCQRPTWKCRRGDSDVAIGGRPDLSPHCVSGNLPQRSCGRRGGDSAAPAERSAASVGPAWRYQSRVDRCVPPH